MIRTCKYHGETEYFRDAAGKNRCRKCHRVYHLKVRRRTKARLVDFRGGRCERCGYDRPETLMFRYINDENKTKAGSHCPNNSSLSKNEIKKCVLICPNCNRLIKLGLLSVH